MSALLVHGVLAYGRHVHAAVMQSAAADALACREQGFDYSLTWADINGVDRARNTMVLRALEMGARFLLMQDADVHPSEPRGGLVSLLAAMSAHQCAVVGAAVPTRRGDINAEPATPGSVYPGVVGTGYMLLDLHRLRDLPRPWFTIETTEDGCSMAVGEDVGFCRKVAEHGQEVMVDFKTPMVHYAEIPLSTKAIIDGRR